jgi:hypothetical protein
MGRHRTNTICSVDRCSQSAMARQLCEQHYGRWRKYGDPLEPFRIHTPFDGSNPEQFWAKVAVTADDSKCWEWQRGVAANGYGATRLNNKNVRSHRVAWYLTHGTWPSDLILHSCDNRRCCNPNHLRVGTPADNAADMVSRGRQLRGERNHQAKLKIESVQQIKRFLRSGISQRVLARQFNVSQPTIGKINQGQTWEWVA